MKFLIFENFGKFPHFLSENSTTLVLPMLVMMPTFVEKSEASIDAHVGCAMSSLLE